MQSFSLLGSLSSFDELRSMVNLGATPRTAVSTEPRPTTAGFEAPWTNRSANGICTSDGKLMYVNGQWRVRSPNDPCIGTVGFDTTYVYQTTKQPIFVGPFRFDPNIKGPQVAIYDSPDLIPRNWIPFLAKQWDPSSPVNIEKMKALVKSGQAAPCLLAIDPTASGPCWGCLPDWDKSDKRCPSTFENQRASFDYLTRQGPPDSQLQPFQGGTLGTGVDPKGNPMHTVLYSGQDFAWGFYTPADWLAGMGIPYKYSPISGPSDLPNYGYIQQTSLASVFADFGDDCNHAAKWPPDLKFHHPLTGETWGVWVRIVRDEQASGPQLPLGAWNTKTDRPMGWHLEVGFAPYSTERSWYCDILHDVLEALFFIPALLFDGIDDVLKAAFDIAKFIGGLTCDIVAGQDPQKIAAATAAEPSLMGEVAKAVGAFQAMCGPPSAQKIDCKDPKNAKAPRCAPIPLSTKKGVPSWVWWTLGGLVAAGSVAVLISE